jgi:TatD-related deoxyribonuclease
MEYDGPVLDDHLHLDPEHGKGVDAVEEFARSGGTHLMVVNKPSWHLGVTPETGEDFRTVFEHTVDVVERAAGVLDGTAWPVLGVHPGLVSRLVDERGFDPAAARDLMQAGLAVAAEYAADGPAVAIKSGRPHYEVADDVWAASNAVMRRAFELGAEADCAVQLHAEGGGDFEQVGTWAREAGLDPGHVVKHYAGGRTDGVTGSVMSERDRLERAVEVGDPFLMETDFVDDPDRPGAVMGPRTVPRRVRWLVEEGHEDAVRRAHVETPAAVYGVDTVATLD